ncbi:ribosomal RNA processing protein 36 homolog [Neoarius graeffei]|uniref:ribosomal RNA processing protein 36 homolog n=1 Tax=Neoarius graeffei TaxID=443677 RepID=UPI00298C74C3|nr:ribosomal RNA processing protein 36 homolog [Neoarius graeffei]
MAPKRRRTALQQNLQFASPVQMKRFNQTHGISPCGGDEEEEEEDVSEMERNFALFNKRGPAVQKSQMNDESNEATEDEDYSEDFVTEHRQAESTDTDITGSEESHNQRDCRPNTTNTGLHNKTEVKGDLSTLSFEEIIRLQSKVGTKACNKLKHATKKKTQHSEPAKRKSSDRPQEISAKKPVSFLRKLGSTKEPILRDPRFDDLSGEFKPEVFSQTYRFINNIRQREAKMVKKRLKKVKSDAKKEELKSFLKRLENQKRNHQRQEQQREKELHYKRKQRALVGDGHQPFYLKKSDKKKLQLAEKYNELKKSGKLENFLSKKRKRNAVKDRRKLP